MCHSCYCYYHEKYIENEISFSKSKRYLLSNVITYKIYRYEIRYMLCHFQKWSVVLAIRYVYRTESILFQMFSNEKKCDEGNIFELVFPVFGSCPIYGRIFKPLDESRNYIL